MAPIRNGVEKDSIFRALIMRPEQIHPKEPNSLILENSFAVSFKLAKDIELVSDIVGIKQILYNSNTGKNREKDSILVSAKSRTAPKIFKNDNTLLGEKNRSAIIPTITGDIIAAIAAVLYARPI